MFIFPLGIKLEIYTLYILGRFFSLQSAVFLFPHLLISDVCRSRGHKESPSLEPPQRPQAGHRDTAGRGKLKE